MAESIEEPEAPTDLGVEPAGAAAGIAIGLRKGRSRDKADPELDTFLREQTRLVRLQTEHLHEQREVQLSHLKLSRFNELMKAALQVMTALVGAAIVAVVAVMAGTAYQDHGVTIEAFSVPPDLAARGLTGQVAASQLLDRLAQLQQQTVTSRPASSYANDWGGDIKVEIPETGVSVGELNRYLRQWLGSETRISGEVVRTPAGLAVTARAGDAPGRRFEGPEADIDKLIGQAAEAVYQQTQPYRYAVYLASSGRQAEAIAAYARLAGSGPPDERAWAYAGWASTLFQDGRFGEAIPAAEAAIRLNPRLAPAYLALNGSLQWVDRLEDHLVWGRRELALLKSGRAVGLPPAEAANRILQRQFVDAIALGDYRRAAQLGRGLEPLDVEGRAGPGASYVPYDSEMTTLAADHDVTGSRAFGALHPQDANPKDPGVLLAQEGTLDRWNGLAVVADRLLRNPASLNEPLRFLKTQLYLARVATVYAHVGRFADAEAVLQTTPPDCYECLLARGFLAAKKRDWPAADRWYGEAARQGPSLPFAHSDWGQALLWKGDLDGAISKLAEAHRRSPHFADPLELWGEALMARRDYAGAIARFAEADKDAPRWGRNHMRWGEALMLSGRYADARRQYEAANGMDLSKPDRAALNVLLDRTAKGPLHG
jgi:tetratricopeptide (TPR) repeat protein